MSDDKQNMNNKEPQTECNRCGTCCTNGGPALHSQDLDLVVSGKLPVSKLITIRKGELAHNPKVNKVVPTTKELVKINGVGKSWDCLFFNQEKKKCTFYGDRPHSCRVLKCWETDGILELVEKDTLTRLDIIADRSPFHALVKEHEELCPNPDYSLLLSGLNSVDDTFKKVAEKCVNNDLLFRTKVVKDHKISLAEELFYFGRPIFQLLQPFDVKITETHVGVELHWDKP